MDRSPGHRPVRSDAVRNRERIVRAAREEFAAHGLDAPLEAVAERAGVGIGTLYRHFGGRRALLAELDADYRASTDGLSERALAFADPLEGLRWLTAAVRRLVESDLGLAQAVLRSDPRTEGVKAGVLAAYRELLDRAQRAGLVRPDVTPADLRLGIVAMRSFLALGGPGATVAAQRVLGILLDGLATSRTGPTPLTTGPLTDEQADELLTRQWARDR